MNNLYLRTVCLLLITFVLASCNTLPDWIGTEEEAPLPGKRISVLALRSKLKADPRSSAMEVVLPNPKNNASWPLQDVSLVEHPSLKEFSGATTVDVGSSPVEGYRLTSAPVIENNVIYSLDGDGNIEARSTDNIKNLIWKYKLVPKTLAEDRKSSIFSIVESSEKDFLGGNISYADNVVYLSTGRGRVAAINAKNGQEIWQRSVTIPVKSAPVVSDGKVFIITSDNRFYALDAKTGKTLWTNSGISETASFFGAPSPAVFGNIVIAPYSSGEIFALDVNTGKVIWRDIVVSNTERHTSLFNISDIDATPVIRYGKLYVVSHDGILVAFDLYSGRKLWTQSISSLKTPWITRDFLYVITTNDELVCINNKSGLIKWVKQLPLSEKALLSWGGTNTGDRIIWSAPVLAGKKLHLVGSNGTLLVVSPYSGKILDTRDVLDNAYLSPVVANSNMYIFNNDAKLMALY